MNAKKVWKVIYYVAIGVFTIICFCIFKFGLKKDMNDQMTKILFMLIALVMLALAYAGKFIFKAVKGKEIYDESKLVSFVERHEHDIEKSKTEIDELIYEEIEKGNSENK